MRDYEAEKLFLLKDSLIQALHRRGIRGLYAENREDAVKQILSIIPQGSRVGWGGSATLNQTGIKEALYRDGKYVLLDRERAENTDSAEEIMRKIFFADYFLTSCNGISEDGVLVNIDGNANRVSAIAFGPRNVLFVVGRNKIARSEEDAYRRAKYYAAPLNMQRFEGNMPCRTSGKCIGTATKDCMCAQVLVTRLSRPCGRMTVILVNENLGY